MIEGLCIIFCIFTKTTEVLSGEKFPTFVYALSIIRKIQSLSRNIVRCSKILCHQYRILNEFLLRFRGLTIEILWTTMLDSRLRTLKQLSHLQREEAKTILIEQVEEVHLSEEELNTSDLPTETSGTTGDDAFDIFDSPVRGIEDKETEDINNEVVLAQKPVLTQISARGEVENYLDYTIIVSPQVNFFSWRRENMYRFPHIAV